MYDYFKHKNKHVKAFILLDTYCKYKAMKKKNLEIIIIGKGVCNSILKNNFVRQFCIVYIIN